MKGLSVRWEGRGIWRGTTPDEEGDSAMMAEGYPNLKIHSR